MPAVLFVCTANRSRSPLAAACFRKELAAHDLGQGWLVTSAGTWTTDGLPATPDAGLAAKGLGLDISGHRSCGITAEAVMGSDLIVVMEQGQKEALAMEFPGSTPKLHLLSEVATGVPYSLPDPAFSIAASGVYVEIAELIHTGFDRLRALAVNS